MGRNPQSPRLVYKANILQSLYAHRGGKVPEQARRYHDQNTTYAVSRVPRHRGAKFDVEFPDGGHLGGKVLSCTASDCPVDEVCRDRSASVTIAERID